MARLEDDQRTPRDRILAAAAEAFAEHGLAGARVDEIAERAGVNKAMLYYHVGDKAALYREVLVRNFDRVLQVIEEEQREAATPHERLRGFIAALARGVEETAHHPQIMMREIASGGENLDPNILQRIFAAMEHLVGILDDGVEAGVFRPTNPLMTHFAIVGSVVFTTAVASVVQRLVPQAAPPAMAGTHRWTQAELADHLYAMFTQGLSGGQEP